MTKSSLLNIDLLKNSFFNEIESVWNSSHGGKNTASFLGFGILYYGIPYALKSKTCVCLGSGGGFVPKLMRQAQRDTETIGKTILVDANMPITPKGDMWGSPKWLAEDSFFRTNFPEIDIMLMTTDEAVAKLKGTVIDYLHIDADHSFDQSYKDFKNYSRLVPKDGVITMHDTACGKTPEVYKTIDQIKKLNSFEVIDFDFIGAGTAIILRK